ncbi:hypothetical protein ACFLYV_03915 [Chloroflexota bacterium]
MDSDIQKTWKPTTAGILNIVSGVSSIGWVIWISILLTASSTWTFLLNAIPPDNLPLVAAVVNGFLIVLLVMSILEAGFCFWGGIYAIKRKKWGLALTGSIFAALSVFPLGVASIAFVASAKEEFE